MFIRTNDINIKFGRSHKFSVIFYLVGLFRRLILLGFEETKILDVNIQEET